MWVRPPAKASAGRLAMYAASTRALSQAAAPKPSAVPAPVPGCKAN
jgi:hypothetical protein